MVAPAPGGRVRVRVPASSANLGPGFDSVGLALGIWDEYDVRVREQAGLRIAVSGEGAGQVPRDEQHLVHRSMVATWRELGVAVPAGLELIAANAVPHGRGLGSSATATVAGVLAAQALAGEVDLELANDLAARLEGHPDNSSASLFGGLTLSWTSDDGCPDGRPGRTRTVRVDHHEQLEAVVFVPAERLATELARQALPGQVDHRAAACNSGRSALLVEAVTRHPELLWHATRDWLHQEARRSAFPASMALVDALRVNGHAAVISGAGPSVLVLTTAERAPTVQVEDARWRRLVPGIATGAVILDPDDTAD